MRAPRRGANTSHAPPPPHPLSSSVPDASVEWTTSSRLQVAAPRGGSTVSDQTEPEDHKPGLSEECSPSTQPLVPMYNETVEVEMA